VGLLWTGINILIMGLAKCVCQICKEMQLDARLWANC